MKRFFCFVVISSAAFTGILFAQETDYSEENLPIQEETSIVTDTDNPGIGLLDQATEAKLRTSTVADLGQVIILCQRAKKAGLSGENLKYCNQLLASSRLQRGLFFAQSLQNPQSVRPGDRQTVRQMALSDLEDAVTVITDQPTAYLRIAQLNLLPDGDEDRAKEVLKLAIQCAKDEPVLQSQAVQILTELEPEIEKREAILAAAAKNGNPQIRLFHALTLLKLNRNSEASDVLQNLIEAESDNEELQDRIVEILIDFGQYELVMNILNTLHEKGTDGRKNRIDLRRAQLFFKMEQDEKALTLLNALVPFKEKFQGDVEALLTALILRSTVYFTMDNVEDALKDIETAQQIRPDFSPILQLKYNILIVQKNFEEAHAVVKELQSLEPDRPQNFIREIHILTEQKKYDDAIEIVQKLREQYPEELQWVLILTDVYSKQTEYDKALALVEEQLKEKPEDLRWIAAKTKVFSEQKKWDDAVNWLESCLQKTPDSREINLLLISVLADKKNYKAAKERMTILIQKYPDDVNLLRMDSQLLISLGLHSEAVKTLEKVIETEPDDYTSINNLSWLLSTSPIDSIRSGHRALELAEKASELSRYKRAFVLSTLAAAYAELGDFAKAREWSQKSIDLAKTEKDKTEEERKELLENLQKELDCFKQNTPYRELLNENM